MSFAYLFLSLSLMTLGQLVLGDDPVLHNYPHLSSNISSVSVGHGFTATCRLNGTLPPGSYYICLLRDFYNIVQYEFDVPEPKSPFRAPKIILNPENYTDLTLGPIVSFNANSFIISITPLTDTTHVYCCQFGLRNTYIWNRSILKPDLTVYDAYPSASLTLNITQPSLNTPFTVICTLTDFIQRAVAEQFSVSFFSSGEGRLATLEILSNGETWEVNIPSDLENRTSVSEASGSEFPALELNIIEHVHLQEEYWCTVEAPAYVRLVSNRTKGGHL